MSRQGYGVVRIEDVARRAGVSRATAARALAGSARVSAAARAQVAAAAAELRYVPNPAARALATGNGTRVVIAAVSSRPTLPVDGYCSRVVAAAAGVCAAEGIGVGLQVVPLGSTDPLAALAQDPTVRGVVLVNTTDALLRAVPPRLAGRVVSIGVGSPHVPSVDVDTAAAATAIVRHLLDSGRRHLAMITGPRWLPCARRAPRAYAQAVRAAGLVPRLVGGDFTVDSGDQATVEVLRRWPETDAIFAVCDATALGVLRQLRGRGITVPDDVAVAGFDDIAFADYPGLTTSTHPVEAIAAAATRIVLQVSATRAPDLRFGSDLVLRRTA